MDSSYIYKLPDKSEPGTNIEAQFINTLEENKKFYTQHQFEQAKRARELFHSLGTPLINDMKALIQMNTIKNNPVTTEDVDIAKKIFGPDISSLKGKTTKTISRFLVIWLPPNTPLHSALTVWKSMAFHFSQPFQRIAWVKSFEFTTWEDSGLLMLNVTMSSALSWTCLQMILKSRWTMPILKSMFLKLSATIELSMSEYEPPTIAHLSVACPASWSRFLWSILLRSWISFLPSMDTAPEWFYINTILTTAVTQFQQWGTPNILL